jgi:adenylate cyclase
MAAIAVFALLGALQYFCARWRIGGTVLNYAFIAADCLLLALVFSLPNPYQDFTLPPAIAMHSSLFTFFFLFLMQASFSFRPSLVLWCGFCIAAARTGMLVWFASQPGVFTNLSPGLGTPEAAIAARADPNFLFLGFFANEILACLTVSGGLAAVVWRSRRLVESRAAAERSHAGLARYFSPNVVERLSRSAGLAGAGKEQEVAVLFADIAGFTRLCEETPADGVVSLLRAYHDRLGTAVFSNGGTLDKYIGDGLMATFGTPEPGPEDAANALNCARDMIAALKDWNRERASEGLEPVRVGIGIHFGPVIAGDIGNESRLEYGVIGDTVNTASRLEALTRKLNTPLLVSDSLMAAAGSNTSPDFTAGLVRLGEHSVKGKQARLAVWGLPEKLYPDRD